MIPTNCRPHFHRLATVCLLLWCTASVQAEEGIPALLKFAEQYSEQAPVKQPLPGEGKTTKKQTPFSQAASAANIAALRRTLMQREGKLAKKETKLREQEIQLMALRQSLLASKSRLKQAEEDMKQAKKMAANHAAPTNVLPLLKLVSRIRDATAGSLKTRVSDEFVAQVRAETECSRLALAHSQAQIQTLKAQRDEQRKQLIHAGQNTERIRHDQQAQQESRQQLAAMKMQLMDMQKKQDSQQQKAEKSAAEAREQSEKALAKLREQLDTVEKTNQVQQSTLKQKDTELALLKNETMTLKKQHETMRQQAVTTEEMHTRQLTEKKLLMAEVQAMRDRATLLTKPVLKVPAMRQAYAAGTALGRDILTLLDERNSWGVVTDRPAVLAGVVDAFSGKYQLTMDVLSSALAESESAVNVARKQASRTQQKKGDAFAAEFKKQKGVKLSPSGFWYRIDYPGDAAIANGAVLDVVVKEALTDGTIIQDMDLNGKVLSQPLNAYPPLFREAIGYLRNHGELTLVAPPELAYGETGYPPKVPPNATLVYTIRVETGSTDRNTTLAAAPPVPGA